YRERSGEVLAEFDFGAIADVTRHPYRLQCEQHRLARLLLERLQSRPCVEGRFSARVVAAGQRAGGVAGGMGTAAGAGRLGGRARGGRPSPPRQSLGIPFEGFTWPERFLVVSTPFPFEAHLADLTLVNYVADPEEWFFLLRVPGLWRVMFPTRPEEDDAEVLSDASVARRLRPGLARAPACPGTHPALSP